VLAPAKILSCDREPEDRRAGIASSGEAAPVVATGNLAVKNRKKRVAETGFVSKRSKLETCVVVLSGVVILTIDNGELNGGVVVEAWTRHRI